MIDGCSRFQTFYRVTLPLLLPGLAANAVAAPPVTKSIDFYLNFPGRAVDFLVGNNSEGWANTTKGLSISEHTRSVYQCCNGFELGADGMQKYCNGDCSNVTGNNRSLPRPPRRPSGCPSDGVLWRVEQLGAGRLRRSGQAGPRQHRPRRRGLGRVQRGAGAEGEVRAGAARDCAAREDQRLHHGLGGRHGQQHDLL